LNGSKSGKPVVSSVGDVLTCIHISHHPFLSDPGKPDAGVIRAALVLNGPKVHNIKYSVNFHKHKYGEMKRAGTERSFQ
jgi:hypothetical protein